MSNKNNKPKDPSFESFLQSNLKAKSKARKKKNKPNIKPKNFVEGSKAPLVKKRGGGTFDMEIKIPKEMVTQGVMYGYKKGGQV
tara:strand:- start:1091 stop:1342 length:252 start_codon:yes stop_codon:yes gene_type:complete